jgi:DNA-binding response OmpR family regulator
VSDGAKKQEWEERGTEPQVHTRSGVRQRVAGEDEPLANMRIVWLDPDHSFSSQCRDILEGWGASILVVEDAGTGVDTVAATSPDALVICYDDRADSSCDQVARVVHFMVAEPPPVILISKRDLRGFDGALPGVVRVLPKPFYPRALLDTLLLIKSRQKSR